MCEGPTIFTLQDVSIINVRKHQEQRQEHHQRQKINEEKKNEFLGYKRHDHPGMKER